MTDRPIIFSGQMVKALLAGRKTQTRRLATSPLRRVEVGDRLWVKERGWIAASGLAFQPYAGNEGDAPRSPSGESYKARPSIHMPRWASRLTLIIEDVRVERLGVISRDDAIAEGIQRVGGGMMRWEEWSGAEAQSATTPELAYAMLWNSLHGPNAWEENPFVVALTFRVVHGNIDRIAA